MSASTGPVAAAVAVVVGNAVVVQGKPLVSQTRVVVGGLLAAGGLALLERALPRTASAFAWLVLASVLLVRVDPNTPSPGESFQAWYNAK